MHAYMYTYTSYIHTYNKEMTKREKWSRVNKVFVILNIDDGLVKGLLFYSLIASECC